ncbi:LemA protein [Thermotomaculum hydrothermale]|uniref:LemA protein n=1 Tax=Thermotomaculum hydrothermale TaxID=981385 RepID=A0A7R6SXT7_9BACT|nr:LemA family protein [Thermotomaculum hydrothermale]BBB32144.1 LemA protein [Thermotomaculum hydrothermale]
MSTVLIIFCLVILFYLIFIYNKIIYFKNLAKQAEADIDVFLKKRHDLLGKLIDVVKGYSDFEKSTLKRIVEVRNLAFKQNVKNAGELEGEIREGIKSLFALVENYPDLKANENYLELQKEITDIEEDLQKARRFYNGVVQSYNTFIEKFPNIIVAKVFNLKPLKYFDFKEA